MDQALSPCLWDGVVCSCDDNTPGADAGNGIMCLRLRGNQLQGKLPTELGLLTKMTGCMGTATNNDCGLELSVNTLSGSLPTQIGRLSILSADFLLFSNHLSGTIPSQIGMMQGLSVNLNLGHNSLEGEVPSQLGSLSNLQRDMYLVSNQGLCGRVPSSVDTLCDTLSEDSGSCDIRTSNPNLDHPCSNSDSSDFFLGMPLLAFFGGLGVASVVLILVVCVWVRRVRRARAWNELDEEFLERDDDWSLSPSLARLRASSLGELPSPHSAQTETTVALSSPNGATSSLGSAGGRFGAYLVDRKALKLEARPFAAGAGGQVFKGSYCGSPVAAKAVYAQVSSSCLGSGPRVFGSILATFPPIRLLLTEFSIFDFEGYQRGVCRG